MATPDRAPGARAIRWGLIGASTIARQRVIGAIRHNAGDILAVYSRSPTRGPDYAASNDIPSATTSLPDLLGIVDAVYVSTTNELHCEHAIAAARAGCHVLCEKPLAISLESTAAMIAACRTAGVVLATNHHLRSNAVHQAMRRQIAAGAIGRPLFARVFNAGYLPRELQGWRLNQPEGAGVTLDKLVHDVDTLRYLLGEEPVSVSASVMNSGMAAEGIEDGVMGVIRFGSGLLAQFHDAFSTPAGKTGLQVMGTEGTLIGSNCLTGGPVGELELHRPDSVVQIVLEQHDPYAHVIAAFHAAIQGIGPPEATGEDGQIAVAVALAAAQSARLGREVRIG